MLMLAAWSVQAQSTTGSLAGTVTGQDGSILRGVIVTYLLPPLQGAQTVSGGMVTAADGLFQFPNLPSGTYYLCAYPAPGLGLLNTCEWTRNAQTAIVTAGQATTGVSIVIQKGQRLHVRVNDPQQMLAIGPASRTGALLMAGVWEPTGFYHTLPLQTWDATGQDFELAVPTAMPFHPTLAAPNAQVTDSTGASVLNQGAGLSLQIPSGTSFQQWTFTVQPTATMPAGTQQRKPGETRQKR
jgi:hypothetical protein